MLVADGAPHLFEGLDVPGLLLRGQLSQKRNAQEEREQGRPQDLSLAQAALSAYG